MGELIEGNSKTVEKSASAKKNDVKKVDKKKFDGNKTQSKKSYDKPYKSREKRDVKKGR